MPFWSSSPEVSLGGGDITFSGTDNAWAALKDEGGKLQLTAVGNTAIEVPIGGNTTAGDVNGNLVMKKAAIITWGNGGTVDITVQGMMEILSTAFISSGTYGEGSGGMVSVHAEELRLDDYAYLKSETFPGSTGKAGDVQVTVDGMLEMHNTADISSSTESAANAGKVTVYSDAIRMDGFSRIISETKLGSQGKAGDVLVSVDGMLEMYSGASIATNKQGYLFSSADGEGDTGDAGGVTVRAGELRMDGKETFSTIASDVWYSQGNAGSVSVSVKGMLEMFKGAKISNSSCWSDGNAGSVRVEAGELRINGQGEYSGITSDTIGNLSASDNFPGNAGAVNVVVAGKLEMYNGAQISTDSSTAGDAGTVTVSAEELRIEGVEGIGIKPAISSAASFFSTGLAGNIRIIAHHIHLLNGGYVSIENNGKAASERLANFQNGRLYIEVDSMEAIGESYISASSLFNAPASSVFLKIADHLLVQGSSQITTSAYASDGGDITVTGPGYVLLRDGLITTSTKGGRGGNISLGPEMLILDTGFVQANTEFGPEGGDISLNARAVIAESNQIAVGDTERLAFRAGSGMNVIQAAAPAGNPGNIVIATPELDISGSLVNLDARLTEPVRLAADPCLVAGTAEGSSLVVAGAGGVPAVSNAYSTFSFEAERLDNILNYEIELKR
ncbi:MAG: hypothetical protein V2B19_32885 [Pseudomonadota bacterium]